MQLSTIVNKANFITEERKNYLCENGFLRSDNRELLCKTLVWVFGIQFTLRAGQEHRNLRFINSQLSLQRDESGHEFLQHLLIKISERSFTLRYDDAMSSPSSEKRIKF